MARHAKKADKRLEDRINDYERDKKLPNCGAMSNKPGSQNRRK